MRTDLAAFGVGIIGLAGVGALGGVLPNWLVPLAAFAVIIWMIGVETDESRRRMQEKRERHSRRER